MNEEKNKPIYVDIYARVSTDDQNVDQQVKYLKKWVIRMGYFVSSVTKDEESGTLPLLKRKKFLHRLKHPKGDAMLIYNLDRLTRNWDDCTTIEKHFRDGWEKYKLISMSDNIDLSNANGRLMFRIQLAVNCNMPESMREKQVIGIARAKAEGKYNGRKKGAVGKK